MRNFLFGIILGTVLATMGAHAAGKDWVGVGGRSPLLNDERERQFQLQLDHMRQQTELEQARIQGKKTPC